MSEHQYKAGDMVRGRVYLADNDTYEFKGVVMEDETHEDGSIPVHIYKDTVWGLWKEFLGTNPVLVLPEFLKLDEKVEPTNKEKLY